MLPKIRGEEKHRKASAMAMAYETITFKVKEQVTNLILEEQAQVYEEISTFCLQSWTEPVNYINKLKNLPWPIHKVPTALLLLGGTSADSDLLYDQLAEHLQREVSPLVSQIKLPYSSDNGSLEKRLNDILKEIIKQTFRRATLHRMEKYGENEDKAGRMAGVPERWQISELNCLDTWYNQDYSEKNQTLIFIFEDLHLWRDDVVRGVFKHLYYYVKMGLPIVVVTGLASLHSVHDKFNFEVKRKVFAQEFRLKPANKVLDKVVTQVVRTSTFPLQLSGDLAKKIMQNFRFNSFSTAKFILSLKMLMDSHFTETKCAKLCLLLVDDIDEDEVLKSLTGKDFETIRGLKSVQKTKLPVKYGKEGRNQIKQWCDEWKTLRAEFSPTFILFHSFIQEINCVYIDEMSLYFDLLQHSSTESTLLKPLWDAIGRSGLRILQNWLQTWTKKLPKKKFESVIQDTNELIKECEGLQKSQQQNVNKSINKDTAVNKTKKSIFDQLKTRNSGTPSKSRRTNSRLNLTATIKKAANQHLKPFQNKVTSLFQEFVDEHLPSVNTLPLNELFCCDDTAGLTEAYETQPHKVIINTFQKPKHQDDISKLWCTWEETDKTINSVEWLKRFIEP
eukprot:UN25387